LIENTQHITWTVYVLTENYLTHLIQLHRALEKLTVSHLVKKLWPFTAPKCLSLSSQQPIYEAVPLHIILPPTHKFDKLYAFQIFWWILHAMLISFMCTTCPAYLILIDMCAFTNNIGWSPSLYCYILLSYGQIFSSAPLPSFNCFPSPSF
jgi:hypothetical protein